MQFDILRDLCLDDMKKNISDGLLANSNLVASSLLVDFALMTARILSLALEIVGSKIDIK